MIARKTSAKIAVLPAASAPDATALLAELRPWIAEAPLTAARAVNVIMTALHWSMCERIGQEVLGGEREAHGEEIISTLSRQLNWSHFSGLIHLKAPLARYFNAQICGQKGWNVLPPREVFQQKIHSAMLAARARLGDKTQE